MPTPLATYKLVVYADGSVGLEIIPPPAVVDPPVTPTPTPPPPPPGVPLAPGFNWSSLKATTRYVLSDGEYKGPGSIKLPSDITLTALNAGKVVIKGETGKPNLWGTDADNNNTITNLILVDVIFDGGGFGVGNHQAAVRTGNGWRLIRTTHRNSGGVGINIEGDVVYSEGLIAEDNAAAGRGGKVSGYVENNAITRRNNRIAKDGNGGGGKFTKSENVTINGLRSYDNTGPGLWLDGNKGDFTIDVSAFYNNVARKPADDQSTGRGLYIEYQLAGEVSITGSDFYGNEGAGLDVAESALVTIGSGNEFLAGKPGSLFEAVAIQLRDIPRDYDDGRKNVKDILQKLTVVNNKFTYPLRIQRDKASQDIRISKNTLAFTNNVWLDMAGLNGVPRIDVPN